ncbi:MAG: hypothetical protein RLZZ26_190, partial [Candidatus Parcubacteria bacterium]
MTVMIEFAMFVLFIVVLISNRSLANRVAILENKLKGGVPVQPPAAQPAPQSVFAPQAVVTGGMAEYIPRPT